MKNWKRGVTNIIKVSLIIAVIMFALFCSMDSQLLQSEKRFFDLESATIISSGISATFCLVIYSKKEV